MQFRDRYDIVKLLGRGTSASVYFVRDKHLKMHWAAKLFDTSLFQQKDWMCLENEIQILKKVRSLRMPRIIDLYREPDKACLVMEYMEGHRLDQYIDTYGPVGEVLTLQWMLELTELIGQLHQMSPTIVYCDLKPENIILQKDGHLALVDFGSARMVANDKEQIPVMTGTKGYTEPELEVTQELDIRADIYSIGAVASFLLSGRYQLQPKLLEENIRKEVYRLLNACLVPRGHRIMNCEELKSKIHRLVD